MNLYEYRIKLDGRGIPIFLFPFFDCHVGSANCDMKKLQENIDWAQANKNVYVVFGGDQIDAINFSDKRFDYDNIAEFSKKGLNNLVNVQTDRFIKMFKPLKGRIIGLLAGNHEEKIRLAYHFDACAKMCDALETRFLGYSAMIRLVFERGRAKNSCIVFMHHGVGAGTVGSQLNKIHNVANDFEADIFLMGHCHQKVCSQSERLEVSHRGDMCLRARKRVFALCGTYLRTYQQDQMGYGEKRLYKPTTIGGVKIRIEPFLRTHANGKQYENSPHIHLSE